MNTIENVNASHEAKFNEDEFFFSITDHNSTILAGNDVFYRVSGYSKDELIGKYHNMIRHDDMPKIIFKTLWDYIQSDRPIIAYVKNKAKDGSYYWVVAAVFPLEDRYVSIRFKPSSPLFEKVKELYMRLLLAESRGGIEEAQQVLTAQFDTLGYRDYDHFMSDAFLQELKKQKEVIAKPSCFDTSISDTNALFDKLKPMHVHSVKLINEYDQWFENIDVFLNMKASFEEKGMLLRTLARDIVFLSLNASVYSYKVEQRGESFGVLASDIRVNAKENDTLINSIDDTVHNLSNSLSELTFVISCMYTQSKMVDFIIEESGLNSYNVNMEQISDNTRVLLRIMLKDSEKLKLAQLKLVDEIKECLLYLDRLEQQMMYLGYVQIYGIIEAAANEQASAGFGVIFGQLKELVRQTSEEVENMQKIGRVFNTKNAFLMKSSEGTINMTTTFSNDFLTLMHEG